MRTHVRTATNLTPLVLVLALNLTGCGRQSAAPTAPSSGRSASGAAATTVTTTATTSTPPPTTFGPIIGWVVDTAFRSLPGARVEVLGGPDAGQSVVVDADGHFSMAAGYEMTTPFRATAEGYVTATDMPHSSSPGGQKWIVFYLEPQAPRVNIAGDYALTLTADTACTDLPEEVRTRAYAATITEASTLGIPNYFSVSVRGIASGISQSFSSIGVAGHDLGFDLSRNHNGVPTLVEQVAPDTYVLYFPNDGFAGTSVDNTDSAISTAFDGVIDYSVAGRHLQCAAANHRLVMTRR